jgi:hypothetical protein
MEEEALIITVTTMEGLLSPCTRYRDIANSQGRLDRFGRPIPELPRELNLDISTEELLSAERAFTYANLYAMIGNEDTIAWLTPHAAVARRYGTAACHWNQNTNASCGFSCTADGKDIVAVALSPEHLLEICDIVLRLLAVSIVHSVNIRNDFPAGELINAPRFGIFDGAVSKPKFVIIELSRNG